MKYFYILIIKNKNIFKPLKIIGNIYNYHYKKTFLLKTKTNFKVIILPGTENLIKFSERGHTYTVVLILGPFMYIIFIYAYIVELTSDFQSTNEIIIAKLYGDKSPWLFHIFITLNYSIFGCHCTLSSSVCIFLLCHVDCFVLNSMCNSQSDTNGRFHIL